MMSRLRAVTGPILFGIAVWCASGGVAVASLDAATPRIVVPAPWWSFALGALAGFAVPRFRRNPRFVLPAMMATLPWWPVPLPPVALLWTGPLVWAPIGLSLFAALADIGPRAAGGPAEPAAPHREAALAAILTAIVALGVAWIASPHGPGGDEPHYLAITQSLIRDGDLRIENNHHDPDFVSEFGDIKPDYLVRGRDGAIYSIHAPGVAVLVLPGYGIAGYHGAQAVLIVAAACTGALIWITAWRATRDRRAAWFAWAAIAGSATFLVQSFTVYPDGPGALAVAACVWLLVRLGEDRDPVGWPAVIATSVLLAALPWLHTRFSLLAAGLGVLIAWRLLIEPARGPAARAGRLVAFGAVPLVSVVGWLAYFVAIYGTPNPAAPYGMTSGPEGTHASYAPGGLMGMLLDEQFGLLAYAPVLAAAAVGLARARAHRIDRLTAAASVVCAIYLAGAATYWMWWAGVPSSPARLVAAALPVLAVPLARAWTDASAGSRATLLVLLGATLAISALVFGVDRSALVWNVRDAEARWLEWLGPLANLPRGWPSFFWSLSPGHPWSELPFIIHALAWVGLFTAGWVFLVRLAALRGWSDSIARLAAAWWLLASISGGVMLGWWLTDGRPLDPTRAELAVLTDIGAGRPAVRLDAFSVSRVRSVTRLLRIATEEIGPDGSEAWATFSDVPPGTYRVQVRLSRPQTGAVRVTIDRGEPIEQDVLLQPFSEQAFGLALPQGATRLTFAPDQALRSVEGVVEIEPLTVTR